MLTVQTERQRDYLGPVTNTDVWDQFVLRPDDVFVCTPPKCGTTWTLSIVMMLIHGGVVADAGHSQEAPWLDCGFRDRAATAAFLDGLTRRRCIKSHTPLDGIAYGAEPTYIVVYRHPVDVHFSMRTHAKNMKEDSLAYLFPDDERAGFQRFLDAPPTDSGTDDLSLSSIVHHYQQARLRADNKNVHFFHYADLSRDLHGQIAHISEILGLPVSPSTLDAIVEANTFASMRKATETSSLRFDERSPFRDHLDFFASGTSNKWEDRLASEDMAAYATRIRELLDEKDAAWLNWGGSSGG